MKKIIWKLLGWKKCTYDGCSAHAASPTGQWCRFHYDDFMDTIGKRFLFN